MERLAVSEPVSRESWALLARLVRHLLAAAEDRHDPLVLLLRELHRTVMTYVDRTAAPARQNGAPHGDDDTEA